MDGEGGIDGNGAVVGLRLLMKMNVPETAAAEATAASIMTSRTGVNIVLSGRVEHFGKFDELPVWNWVAFEAR
jgi:hypothetical protein